MKRFIFSIILFLFVTMLVGCGALRGLGEDISAVGGWLTRGSDKAQSE